MARPINPNSGYGQKMKRLSGYHTSKERVDKIVRQAVEFVKMYPKTKGIPIQ